jgi:hypothetical protein
MTKIPEEYLCPISREIMFDPVILSTGQTYNRKEIKTWLNTHTTCPQSRREVDTTLLIPNIQLRSIIHEYCTKHNIEIPPPPPPQTDSMYTDVCFTAIRASPIQIVREEIYSLVSISFHQRLNIPLLVLVMKDLMIRGFNLDTYLYERIMDNFPDYLECIQLSHHPWYGNNIIAQENCQHIKDEINKLKDLVFKCLIPDIA